MIAFQLLLGALTLVTNAFFVGAEFALISVRRSQIEPRAQAGDRRAQRVVHALENVSAMMATAQLGITVSSLVLGAVAEPAIAHLLEPGFEAAGIPHALVHPIAFVIALALATYLHMLIGEMIPKNIALAAPERTALLLGPALVTLTRLLRPLIHTINTFANLLLRLIGVQAKDEVASVFTAEEMTRMVEETRTAGLLDPHEQERLADALELGSRPVTDVLLTTQHTVTVTPEVTPRQLQRLTGSTGFSRFPVVTGDGRIQGYLHVKDALTAPEQDAPVPRAAWRPILSIPADATLDDAMETMRRDAAHIAAVVGPGGRTAGLVTMEDVLEELVGEINDPSHRRALQATRRQG
ncbi:hemolysin family protein [Allostreptomyces psammosilenae]|uniref:CBS domain containing-hemolysin-like protein n=1 Tax=Allostreptomyces psammosilenae TaxID=1892865 RepID=A0A852ZXR6_9ACTN|nr:hemolysin family protein [Allostreptomyces psammosilenae]NYI06979.1 CBS domain containing-hemolysin-like protein [Allostreptomyces psammosilenae]